jgi:hypothetical protein
LLAAGSKMQTSLRAPPERAFETTGPPGDGEVRGSATECPGAPP